MSKKKAGIDGSKTGRITSNDVARYTGMSQSTVSRVLSPGSDSKIRSDTREKILQAAKELGYKPNAIARSLTSQRTNIIGIALSKVSSPFYSYILEGFTKRLYQMGKQVLLFCTDNDRDIDEVLATVLQYRIDGLIIATAGITSVMAEECHKNGTSVVLFNRIVPGANVNGVSCDNVSGGSLAADLFADAGYRDIAYISGKEDSSTNLDRRKGFMDRLKDRGIGSCMIEKGEYSYESGIAATRRLFSRKTVPQAIFCASDEIALGAMHTIQYEIGLKIPEDVSIVGFDDIAMASWPFYSLTTVRQPVEEMMDYTVELLCRNMENPEMPHERKVFEAKLIRRHSAKITEIKGESL